MVAFLPDDSALGNVIFSAPFFSVPPRLRGFLTGNWKSFGYRIVIGLLSARAVSRVRLIGRVGISGPPR